MNSLTELKEQHAEIAQSTATIKKMTFGQLKKDHHTAVLNEQPTVQVNGFKLSESPAPAVFISDAVEKTFVHYTDFEDLHGYTKCNGEGCLLCRAGNKAAERILMPAYNPISKTVQVLSMGTYNSPTSLLPQILALVDFEQEQLFMMSRQGFKFTVNVKSLPESLLLDMEAIKAFSNLLDADKLTLADIYRTLTNDELAAFPSIQTMLTVVGQE